jgi:predicted RNase H-related nuclease YkuK (DUF458 family)
MFGGGDGKTRDSAVVVLTSDHRSGVRAEYAWIAARYPRAQSLGQHLMVPDDRGRRFDVMQIRTTDGREMELWFDVTRFMSRGPG